MLEKPRCMERKCKHFLGVAQPDGSEEGGEYVYCSAFPDGIPDEIAYGDNDHTSSFPGDRGIQYEGDEDA